MNTNNLILVLSLIPTLLFGATGGGGISGGGSGGSGTTVTIAATNYSAQLNTVTPQTQVFTNTYRLFTNYASGLANNGGFVLNTGTGEITVSNAGYYRVAFSTVISPTAVADTNKSATLGILQNGSVITTIRHNINTGNIGDNNQQYVEGVVNCAANDVIAAGLLATSGGFSIACYGNTLIVQGLTAGNSGSVGTVTNLSGTDGISVTPGNPIVIGQDGTLDTVVARLAGDAAVSNVVEVTVEAFGAVGDGVADDTIPLQAAINLAQSGAGGRLVKLHGKTYRITAPLVITNAINISGAGVNELHIGFTNPAGIYFPSVPPYLSGAVIRQDTGGADILQITNVGRSVNLSGFGLTWATNHCWTNTGFGINATPPPFNGRNDLGIFSSTWRNLAVFGVASNKYAFKVVNITCGKFETLRSFGGGGFWSLNNNTNTPTGNSHLDACYFQVMTGPVGDALRIETASGGQPNNIWQITQCQLQLTPSDQMLTMFGMIGSVFYPNKSQYCLYVGDNVNFVSGQGNSIETYGGSYGNTIRLPSDIAGLDMGAATPSGAAIITNVATIVTRNGYGVIPRMMSAPISWGPRAQGTDDTLAQSTPILRPLDNPLIDGSKYYWDLATSLHYLRWVQTFTGTNYGYQWGVANQGHTAYTNLMHLDQGGDLWLKGRVLADGSGLTNQVLTYQLTTPITNATASTVWDGGLYLAAGTYTYQAEAGAEVRTNNGVYMILGVSNVTAVVNGLAHHTYSPISANTNGIQGVSATHSFQKFNSNSGFDRLLGGGADSSVSSTAFATAQGHFTLSVPTHIRWGVQTWSGTPVLGPVLTTNTSVTFYRKQ